jgi:hypothetical protein
VVKNSLSLSAVLTAEPGAVVVVVSAEVVLADVAGTGAGAGACSKSNTWEKAASRRVTPRLGALAAASALDTVLVLAELAVALLA